MFLYEKIAVQIHFMFSFFMTVSLNSGFLFGEPSQHAGCERTMFLGNWISSPWCQGIILNYLGLSHLMQWVQKCVWMSSGVEKEEKLGGNMTHRKWGL